MIVFDKFCQESDPCSYLPDRKSIIEYELAGKISSREYESRMNRGWRKFGYTLFHPVCLNCLECIPIRVPVGNFTPSRSQIRSARKNNDLVMKIGRPIVDSERLALFDAYHVAQAKRKGWPEHYSDEKSYFCSFIGNPIQAAELSIWEGKVLRGVILLDVTPKTISAVYHYYDLSISRSGLGTLLILLAIEYARSREKPWVYLGYFVNKCRSMEYKTRFRPFELLGSDGLWGGSAEKSSLNFPGAISEKD